jgi:hypothetical protein
LGQAQSGADPLTRRQRISTGWGERPWLKKKSATPDTEHKRRFEEMVAQHIDRRPTAWPTRTTLAASVSRESCVPPKRARARQTVPSPEAARAELMVTADRKHLLPVGSISASIVTAREVVDRIDARSKT